MRKRTIIFVPAVLAAVAATATLTAPTSSAAPAAAAAECAAKPGAAAQGGRWKYRTDRTSGRRCWFLAGEGASARRAIASKRRAAERAAEEPAPVTDDVEPAQDTAAAIESQPAGDFTVRWTQLQQQANALKENPAVVGGSYATEEAAPSSAEPTMEAQVDAQVDAQDEMPLVWPVLTPAELAAAEEPARARALGIGPVLALVGGALTLAGMMFAIISLSGPRPAPAEGGQDLQARRPRPARFSRSVAATFAEAAATAREANPPREWLIPAPAQARESEAPLKPSAPPRRPGSKREPIRSGERLDELEERMPWLVRRGNRTAAA